MMDNIIREKYEISKKLHTSFTDLDDVTPYERKVLLKLMIKDMERENQAMNSISNT